MDLFNSIILHLAVLYISLSLIYLLYKHKSTGPKLPPGKKGLPFIGETLEYLSTARRGIPEKFINDRTTKYSPDVFRTSLLGENMAVLCGASGNKFLFSGQNKYVKSWLPYSTKKVLTFPSTVENFSEQESRKLHRLRIEFLKPESLRLYIPIVDSMAKEHLETDWAPYSEVKVFPLSKKYTFALACRLFMSVSDPKLVAKVAAPFVLLTAGLISVPIDLPSTPFSRAVKGGKLVWEELLAIVRKRREELLENKEEADRDLLSSMFLAANENGEALNEMKIVNKIIGFFIASHDSTSTAITFVLKYLADFPHIYSEVYKEQMEISKSKGPNELLNWDDVKKMKYSWNVACESLRLSPPSHGGFREAIADFTFGGFTIPKGWKTYWSVYSTHKNPKYFPDPEKFDPSRFEGNGPAPYTFVPFGGGPRMCPGREYARLQILVFIHNVVTKFKLERAIPNEKITYMPSPIPVNDLPIRLKPHAK